MKKTPLRFTFGVVAAVLVLGAALAANPVSRLVHVLNLFHSDEIVENFRTMDTALTSKTVHHGEAWNFQRAPRPLPATFVWQGKEQRVDDYLAVKGATGLLVLKDDTILYEQYFRGNTEASRTIAWSVSKSFLSALFGIAVGEGKIKSIEEKVSDYVPGLAASGYGNVRIKDVLQMSSGIAFNEDYGDFNSDINIMGREFALNRPLADFIAGLKNGRTPGTYNHYVSMDTQVLGMILVAATGESLTSYTERKLWKPLGMESDAAWLIDSTGMEAAFGGFNVVLRDYARFGRLYLHGGNWNGVQIVPADWVKASVTPDAPHLMPGPRDSSDELFGYGYQWWIPEDAQGDFLAIGVYGQNIYISPRTGMVVVRTSAYANYNHDPTFSQESVALFKTLVNEMSR